MTETRTRTCILVLGMHRSGTSAATRVIGALGATLPRNLVVAADDNPKGFWEPELLLRCNEELLRELKSSWHDWQALPLGRWGSDRYAYWRSRIRDVLEDEYGQSELFVVKEPRICRLPTLFLDALSEMGVTPRIVVPFRNPLDVARSLEKRNGLSRENGLLLWLRHVLDCERATRELPRAFLSYDELLADWRSAMTSVAAGIGLEWPRSLAEAALEIYPFLTPELRHHKDETLPEQAAHELSWARDAYLALGKLRSAPSDIQPLKTLDAIGESFNTAAALMGREVTQLQTALAGQRAAERAARSEADAHAGRIKELSVIADEHVTKISLLETQLRQSTDEAERQLSTQRSRIEALETAEARQVAEISRLEARLRLGQEKEELSKREFAELQAAIYESGAQIARYGQEHDRVHRTKDDAERRLHEVTVQLGDLQKKTRSSRWLFRQISAVVIHAPRDVSRRVRRTINKRTAGKLAFAYLRDKSYRKYLTSHFILKAEPILPRYLAERMHRRKYKHKPFDENSAVRGLAPRVLRQNSNLPTVVYESHNLRLQGAPQSLCEIAFGMKQKKLFRPIVTSCSDGPLKALCESEGVEVVCHGISPERLQSREQVERAVIRLAKIYNDLKVSLVHVNTLRNFHAVAAAHRAGIPTLWNIRESETPSVCFKSYPEAIQDFASSCFPLASRVVFVAQATRKLWNESLDGVVTHNLVHNGLATERLMSFVYGTNRPTIRRKLCLRDDDILLLNVGTVTERKGQEDLVDALKLLNPSTLHRLVVAVAGFTSSTYGKNVKDKLRHLERDGLRVIVLDESKNADDRRDLVELYFASDIFVLCSRKLSSCDSGGDAVLLCDNIYSMFRCARTTRGREIRFIL